MTPLNKIWVSFELQDLAEHLADVLDRLRDEDYDEAEYRIDIGHAFHHLNSAWNARNAEDEEPTEENLKKWAQFPSDIEPI
ncbi:MAG TPA: hypothetical protein VF681_14720 [Abditibacteriaceae bacterium]|jgi:hypothetical protein